jgi:hypothetical protein
MVPFACMPSPIPRQFGKLTLTPVRENGTLSYAAKGKVDFFGEEAMIRVGGAGGRACT